MKQVDRITNKLVHNKNRDEDGSKDDNRTHWEMRNILEVELGKKRVNLGLDQMIFPRDLSPATF